MVAAEAAFAQPVLILLDDEIQMRLEESPVNGRSDLCQEGFESNVAVEPRLCSPKQASSPEKVQQTAHHFQFLSRFHCEIELVVAQPAPLTQEGKLSFFAVLPKLTLKTTLKTLSGAET